MSQVAYNSNATVNNNALQPGSFIPASVSPKEPAGSTATTALSPAAQKTTGLKFAGPSASNVVSPTIITSKAADKDLTKIKGNVSQINTGIQNQTTKLAADKVAADKVAADKAVADAKTKTEADAAAAAKTAADAKMKALTGNQPAAEPTKTAEQLALEKTNADYQTKADAVEKSIADIQSGAIPLNAGEQAQVDGLKQQFQQLISEQQLANTNASGIANVRGYQTGAAEYDPSFQVKTIGSIVSAGMNKVADLNTKMAASVAALTQSFKDNDIAKIKETWDIYNEASQKRSAELTKTIEKTQAAIKDAKDAKIAADKVQYEQVTKPIQDVALDAAKNGADAKILAAIKSATDVNSALAAAGNYLQSATGTLGDYLQYKRDTEAKGLVPHDYQSFKDAQDAKTAKLEAAKSYNNAYNSAAGKAAAEAKTGGISGTNDTVSNLAQQLVAGNIAPSELSKRATGSASYNAVLKAADDYSMKTTGKHFSIAQADRDYKFAQRPQTQDTLNYLKSLTGTADTSGNLSGGNLDELKKLSDSISRTKLPALNDVKAWTKLGTGNVAYAQYQTVATEVADQVAKILQGGGGGGTSDAKLQQAVNMFNTGFSKDQMAGVIESLKPLLANRAKSMVGDNSYLKDYADELGINNNGTPSAKSQVNNFIAQNPELKQKAQAAYVPGATDQDVLDYLNSLTKVAQK